MEGAREVENNFLKHSDQGEAQGGLQSEDPTLPPSQENRIETGSGGKKHYT